MSDSESGWQQRGFRIRGRVQGVGFRWWTRGRASDLGLRGTVGNRPDGTVEVHAVGDVDTLEVFAAGWRSVRRWHESRESMALNRTGVSRPSSRSFDEAVLRLMKRSFDQ